MMVLVMMVLVCIMLENFDMLVFICMRFVDIVIWLVLMVILVEVVMVMFDVFSLMLLLLLFLRVMLFGLFFSISL